MEQTRIAQFGSARQSNNATTHASAEYDTGGTGGDYNYVTLACYSRNG